MNQLDKIKLDIQNAMKTNKSKLEIGQHYLKLSQYLLQQESDEKRAKKAVQTALALMLRGNMHTHYQSFQNHLNWLLSSLATGEENLQTQVSKMVSVARSLQPVLDCLDECKSLRDHCATIGNLKQLREKKEKKSVREAYAVAQKQVVELKKIVRIIQEIQVKMHLPVNRFNIPVNVLDDITIKSKQFHRNLRDKPQTFPADYRPLVELVQSIMRQDSMETMIGFWNQANSKRVYKKSHELAAELCASRGYSFTVFKSLLKRFECIPDRQAVRKIIQVATETNCQSIVEVNSENTRGFLAGVIRHLTIPLNDLYGFEDVSSLLGRASKRLPRTMYIMHGDSFSVAAWEHLHRPGIAVLVGDLDTLIGLKDRFNRCKNDNRKCYVSSIDAISQSDSPANIHHETHKQLPTSGILVTCDHNINECDQLLRKNQVILNESNIRERKFQKSLRLCLQNSWSNLPETIASLCNDQTFPIDFVKGVAFVMYGMLKRHPKRVTDLYARANFMSRVVWEQEVHPTIQYLLKQPTFQEDQRDQIYLNTLHFGFCKTHGVIPQK